jgi:hypothetical protein
MTGTPRWTRIGDDRRPRSMLVSTFTAWAPVSFITRTAVGVGFFVAEFS